MLSVVLIKKKDQNVLVWNCGVTLVAAVNKTNFTYPWRYFDGLCKQISSFCVVLCGNVTCLFARVVSAVFSGRKINCARGFRIQRNELFDAN